MALPVEGCDVEFYRMSGYGRDYCFALAGYSAS